MLLLKHEGDFQVHLVAFDVAVLDHDVLILDPGTLYVPQGLGGPSYALLDGILKARIRDSADLCYRGNAHIFLSHPFFGCSLTTTSYTYLPTTVRGEAKHPTSLMPVLEYYRDTQEYGPGELSENATSTHSGE